MTVDFMQLNKFLRNKSIVEKLFVTQR